LFLSYVLNSETFHSEFNLIRNHSDCEIDLNYGLLNEVAHQLADERKPARKGQTKFQISDKPEAAPTELSSDRFFV